MIIDDVSKKIILIALYLDSKVPGVVSEVWLDETQVSLLKSEIPLDHEIQSFIDSAARTITEMTDQRRKRYLQAILDSLIYQIEVLNKEWISFTEFSKRAYGFEIKRLAEQELRVIEDKIHDIEKRIGFFVARNFCKVHITRI